MDSLFDLLSIVDVIVAILNVCSTVALSAIDQRGRITVQGVGKTNPGIVTLLFNGLCVHLLTVSTVPTLTVICVLLQVLARRGVAVSPN